MACSESLGLARTLERMCSLSTLECQAQRMALASTPFHSAVPPRITIQEYVVRLTSFECSPVCYVLCLVYIDRLLKKEARFAVDHFTCHRLLAAALVLAVKFEDDVYYTNRVYAKCSGLSVKELNYLERLLIRLLDYRLFVDASEFGAYEQVISRMSSNPDAKGDESFQC
jgi:hypothetical protein